MPPTPFHPTHTTPFKSSLSSSQQVRKAVNKELAIDDAAWASSPDWPVSLSACKLDARNWTYLAEGGKNLILQYTGPAAEPFVTPDGRRIALRIVKTSRSAQHGPTTSLPSGKQEYNDIDPVKWQRTILMPDLLGTSSHTSSILPPLLSVTGPQEDFRAFLRVIVAKIEPLRPLERRKTTGIDEEQTRDIFITEDLSATVPGQPALVFEVKPKCGFLPNVKSPSACKASISRFRLHSVMRSKHDVSLEEFEQLYDPLDLYSNDANRVCIAAQSLYQAWSQHKGKNLKIFLGGQKVEPKGSKEASAHSLVQSFWNDENVDVGTALSRILTSTTVQEVLSRLVQLQQRYDPIDVEGVDALCKAERGKGLADTHDEPGISLDEYENVTQKIRSVSPTGKEDRTRTNLSAREAIVALLLATSYKDCSLFIRVTKDLSGTASEPKIDVHLVDLDPKPTHKLSYLYTLDQEILGSFAKWAADKRYDQVSSVANAIR